MADNSEPLDETGSPEVIEPSDVGSWLTSLGAPESLTNMIPRDLREFDVSSVLRLLGGSASGGPSDLEGGTMSDSAAAQAPDRSIRWLPVLRE